MEHKHKSSRKAISNIVMRILAVFIASALSVLGAGSLVGVDAGKAAVMAGLLGVANVLEKIARAFLNDGRLTLVEINNAFSNINKQEPNDV